MNNIKYQTPATLVLENGIVFEGFSFGAERSVSGEVVFNTGMVGYPESLTDPSYRGELLTFTYPLIGNYGVPANLNDEYGLSNFESGNIHIQGLIVSNYSEQYSHWNAVQSLSEWLIGEGIPAISGVDTRRLTKILREHGTMKGKIFFQGTEIPFRDTDEVHLVEEVSMKEPIRYASSGKKTVVLIDCGVKNNIIRNLLQRGVNVIRVPYDYNFLSEKFDGLLVSNGPGNPKMCTQTINHLREVFERVIPTFGICLGNQLMALASGGDTYKLKYGHRSQNQPCTLVGTKRCYITSQNHGYAVDMSTMGSEWSELFINANDGTNEGLRHKTKPFFSVQFHPEHTPGPYDTTFLFDQFIESLQ